MAPLSNSLFEKINQNLKINQICEFNSSVVYYQDNKSEQITVKVWTECTVKPSELLARLHLCLFFYWFGNHLYPLSEQQATNRFHNGCMQGAEGLPQHVWMNHTQASAPLLEAANSLFLPSCGHRTTWTAQLCWDRAQHKQPRPVCFIHHPHHFLLESICGLSRIWEIGGLKKKKGWKVWHDLEDADCKPWHNCRAEWDRSNTPHPPILSFILYFGGCARVMLFLSFFISTFPSNEGSWSK